jgi:hypothetical protein
VVVLLHRGDDSSGLFGTAFPQQRPQDGVLALGVQAEDEADLLSVVGDDRGAPGVARRDVADGLGRRRNCRRIMVCAIYMSRTSAMGSLAACITGASIGE